MSVSGLDGADAHCGNGEAEKSTGN